MADSAELSRGAIVVPCCFSSAMDDVSVVGIDMVFSSGTFGAIVSLDYIEIHSILQHIQSQNTWKISNLVLLNNDTKKKNEKKINEKHQGKCTDGGYVSRCRRARSGLLALCYRRLTNQYWSKCYTAARDGAPPAKRLRGLIFFFLLSIFFFFSCDPLLNIFCFFLILLSLMLICLSIYS